MDLVLASGYLDYTFKPLGATLKLQVLCIKVLRSLFGFQPYTRHYFSKISLPLRSKRITSNRMIIDTAYRSPRVLVIDDDPLWRSILPSMLTARGLQSHVVENYEEAMRILYQESFQAFIVDVRLVDHEPDNLEGLALVGNILKRSQSAPILILSGWQTSLIESKKRFENKDHILILNKTSSEDIEMFINDLSRQLISFHDTG